jgi:hypothetical protein
MVQSAVTVCTLSRSIRTVYFTSIYELPEVVNFFREESLLNGSIIIIIIIIAQYSTIPHKKLRVAQLFSSRF